MLERTKQTIQQHTKSDERSMHFSENLIYLLLTLDMLGKIAQLLLYIMGNNS